jgi:hypothetical protein
VSAAHRAIRPANARWVKPTKSDKREMLEENLMTSAFTQCPAENRVQARRSLVDRKLRAIFGATINFV